MSRVVPQDRNSRDPKARSRWLWRVAGLPLMVAAAARAQMHHVEKAEQTTRAVAVYEWTGDLAKPTAARLVPVSLFLDGHFEDAGLYLARPVPFALQSGDIYSVEFAGEPQGLLNIESAGQLTPSGTNVGLEGETIWYGFGDFKANPAVAKAAPLQASRHLSVISNSSTIGSNSGAPAKPTLTDRTGKGSAAGTTNPATSSDGGDHPTLSRRSSQDSAPASTTSASAKPATTTPATGSDGGDHPTLSRRSNPADSTDTSSTTAASKAPVATQSTTPAPTSSPGTSDDDPDRPVLARRAPSTASGSTGSTDAAGKPPSGSTTTPTGSDDSDKPTLTRRSSTDDSGQSQDSKTGSDSHGGSGGADVDRPTLRKRDPQQDEARTKKKNGRKDESTVRAVGPALGDDPDRPTLHRGSAKQEGTPPLEGMPAGLHQAVAVSDATHRDAHLFNLEWEAGQRATVLASLQAIARDRISTYLSTNKLLASAAPLAAPAADKGSAEGGVPHLAHAAAPAATSDGNPPKLTRGKPTEYAATGSSAKKPTSAATARPATGPAAKTAARPVARRTAGRIAAKKAAPTASPELRLQDEQLNGYALSYGGLPTFVYTAAVSTSTAEASIAGPVAYVTLVAQQLPSGELQVSLVSVTDAAHLDRVPWLRLVDVVDPDWSHRASLLFELRGTHSRQFALYRLTSVRAEQTFSTGLIQ